MRGIWVIKSWTDDTWEEFEYWTVQVQNVMKAEISKAGLIIKISKS